MNKIMGYTVLTILRVISLPVVFILLIACVALETSNKICDWLDNFL